uniref:Lectin putative n=1 Tax=Albugo laibachii Nc14 TaxID=890382 RepID=F0WW42_9STRA|nr:lectin putative [Albugo laibachii Nc14]|eukprot:CCA25650.1 lectin putative [Albugo laibachii Nc14]
MARPTNMSSIQTQKQTRIPSTSSETQSNASSLFQTVVFSRKNTHTGPNEVRNRSNVTPKLADLKPNPLASIVHQADRDGKQKEIVNTSHVRTGSRRLSTQDRDASQNHSFKHLLSNFCSAIKISEQQKPQVVNDMVKPQFNSHLRSSTQRESVLPPQYPQDIGKKCLVLDLDETLVHSSFRPTTNPDYIIPVEIDGMLHQVYVCKRPGVDFFLTEMAKYYEIVIYTASLSKYANPLLDRLDPERTIRHRLYREHCVLHDGNYIKDLSLINRDLTQSIIIDNSPLSYLFHPRNAMGCSSFIDDPRDRELDSINRFLKLMTSVDDKTGETCQDESKAWADDIKRYHSEKRTLQWRPEQQAPIRHVTRYDMARQERAYDVILCKEREPEREAQRQSKEKSDISMIQQRGKENQLKYGQQYDIIHHQPVCPEPSYTSQIPSKRQNTNNTQAETFQERVISHSKPPSTASQRTREFDIVSNKFHTNHQERESAIQQAVLQDASEKLTNAYDPIQSNYCDDLQANHLTERRQRSAHFPAQRAYNIVNHQSSDREDSTMGMEWNGSNRVQKEEVEARMRLHGQQDQDRQENRRLHRAAPKRLTETYAHGLPLLAAILGSIPFVPCVDSERVESLSFKSPFKDINNDGIRDIGSEWTFGGNTQVKKSFIRLTPNRQSKRGHIWHEKPITTDELSGILSFRIHGSSRYVYADGLAIWITHERAHRDGPNHGFIEKYRGVGIILDTYHNTEQKGKHKDVTIQINDGTKELETFYNEDVNGCDFSYRYHSESEEFDPVYSFSRLQFGIKENQFYIEMDPKAEGHWQKCFTTTLPFSSDWLRQASIGFSASTGSIADNHDILSFVAFNRLADINMNDEDGDLIRHKSTKNDADQLLSNDCDKHCALPILEKLVANLHVDLDHRIEDVKESMENTINKLKEKERSNHYKIEAMYDEIRTKMDSKIGEKLHDVRSSLHEKIVTKVEGEALVAHAGWRRPFFIIVFLFVGMVGKH